MSRVVIDTNVFVSRFLNPASTAGEAVAKAARQATVLFSTATFAELRLVLRRPKFAPYIQRETLEPFLSAIASFATFIAIPSAIQACRDPRDDKFLEVAVHGQADLIVTGDRDLLDLDPFRRHRILTPAQYLESD